MEPRIEIVDGGAGWARAEAIDDVVYPPEIMKTVVWRDVAWSHADKRILVTHEGRDVCHVGLYFRAGRHDGREVSIGGIGGVMTIAEARKKGCASLAMHHAAGMLVARNCDFGLLFCEPHNFAFYERLGWVKFEGEVVCEQNGETAPFAIMRALVLPLRLAPRAGLIDLRGLPW